MRRYVMRGQMAHEFLTFICKTSEVYFTSNLHRPDTEKTIKGEMLWTHLQTIFSDRPGPQSMVHFLSRRKGHCHDAGRACGAGNGFPGMRGVSAVLPFSDDCTGTRTLAAPLIQRRRLGSRRRHKRPRTTKHTDTDGVMERANRGSTQQQKSHHTHLSTNASAPPTACQPERLRARKQATHTETGRPSPATPRSYPRTWHDIARHEMT